MKKKGPQRSQSLSALPGSSRLGLGKTTSLRLLTMRARSRLTVSQTGSVSVLGGGPKPSEAMATETDAGGAAAGGAWGTKMGTEEVGSGGLEEAGGGEEEMGMEARGGEGGRAGRTVAEGGASYMRLSISSMSDCADDALSGIVSP